MSATRVATDDYVDFCRAIRTLCKIDLEQYKRGQMERRIRTFAEQRGVRELPAYLARLRGDAAELERFLDRITINVSQLWRNPEQWEVLAKDVLPALAGSGRIRAWSAGCSYGAEAYTLAAVAADALGVPRAAEPRGGREVVRAAGGGAPGALGVPRAAEPRGGREVVRAAGGGAPGAFPSARLEVRGTDIDARMVAKAKEGRFSRADARSAPAGALARWFRADGAELVASEELRRRVRFEVGDLLRMRIAPASLDLILCRNTVIYFNEEVRDELHERLAAALRPGGFLIVGATERVANPAGLDLIPTHPFTYRRAS